MKQAAVDIEPPRVRKFRNELVKVIPRVPNTGASLLQLQQTPIVDVIIHYLNWRSRYVGTRPRNVVIESAATGDPRWKSDATAIGFFLKKVRRGDDLTSHLSLVPHTRGYVAAAMPEEKWSDKDFVLNTKGYHHFHLGISTDRRGYALRTSNLLFAQVTRDEFKVIAILDHTVFLFGSAEQLRLAALHRDIAFRNLPAGSTVVDCLLTTSGHTLDVVHYAKQCVRSMVDLEPKLDDLDFLKNLYPAPHMAPAKHKPEWSFLHMDLAIYDRMKPALFVVRKGWN